MIQRPTFTNLVDYVEGRLEPGASAAIEQYLAAGDSDATATVDWMRMFLAVSSELPLEAPPLRVRHYLRRQFEQRGDTKLSLVRVPRQILATLMFDNRRDLAASGVRSADVGTATLHLAFRSEAGDVLVDLSPSADGFRRLDGQVLFSDDWDGQVLEADLSGPGYSGTSAGDDLGRFSFAHVPADVDQLVLRADDVDIKLMWEPCKAS